MKKQVVVLKLARLSIPRKIEKARFIVISMTGNANFTTPSPTLVTITTNVNALETASIAAAGGGADDTANMHAKELLLDLSLKSLAAYVEGIANVNPLSAEAIILSAGMEVKSSGVRTAHEFAVEPTGDPGEVSMSTKFVQRATFIWQMSTTAPNAGTGSAPGGQGALAAAQAGAVWETIGQGTRSKFLKTGLVSGTRYYFRVAVVDKNGQGPWSKCLLLLHFNQCLKTQRLFGQGDAVLFFN